MDINVLLLGMSRWNCLHLQTSWWALWVDEGTATSIFPCQPMIRSKFQYITESFINLFIILIFCLFLPFLNLWEIMALLVSLVVDIKHYCYKVCLFSAGADGDLCASTDQYYKKDPALKIIIANTWRKSQSGEGSSKPKFCCTSNAPLKVFFWSFPSRTMFQ